MRFFKKPHHKQNLGFTLIELLITVAIVGILAQVAYASYASAIQQSNRYAAQQSLIEVGQKLERYYSRSGNYASAGVSTGDYNSNNYTFAFSVLTATTYTVSATPVAGSSQAGDDCSTLTLDYLGAQTPATSGCWK